jgi:glycosyltransferase involved in cell wall biosynthesis
MQIFPLDDGKSRRSAAHPVRPLSVAFAGGNALPPEDAGGVQSSTIDLARRLTLQGHRPSALAPLYGTGAFGLRARVRMKLSRDEMVADRSLGFGAYRAWDPEAAVAAFAARVRPDVAVVQCHGTVPIARAFRQAGVPVVLYFRNVELKELGGDPSSLGAAGFIANSTYTAGIYRETFGIEATVIPPTIDADRYRVAPSGEAVVFMNPVAQKGLDLALRIASECPDIPFLFVESWLLSSDALADLKTRIAPFRNITFLHRTDDVRAIYARARFILAPSQWREAWGRVASEAQCSGLPVVGSDRGGLPEAIGPGGVVVPAEADLAGWVAAVRRLWSDKSFYAEKSAAARMHAERPALNPDVQFATFLKVLSSACAPARADQ